MQKPVIVVHGGAWFIPPEKRESYVEGCRRAALAGWARLAEGASALDAVEAAVRVMEDDPTYDAGRGSHLNREGVVQMDAIIMDGRTLNLGAVAAVERVRYPVSLARRVLEASEHSFLVGPGAEAFAQSVGVPLCAPADLLGTRDPGGWRPPAPDAPGGDTVGAVALDAAGDLAVATSTGGTPDKWPGRVGDSPLVGCGAYADNQSGAASATGSGEMLMRLVISKLACDLMAGGCSAQQAADAAVQRLYARVRGYGGLILVDRAGTIGLAHNTPNMAYAYVRQGQAVVAGAEIVAKEEGNAGVLP